MTTPPGSRSIYERNNLRVGQSLNWPPNLRWLPRRSAEDSRWMESGMDGEERFPRFPPVPEPLAPRSLVRRDGAVWGGKRVWDSKKKTAPAAHMNYLLPLNTHFSCIFGAAALPPHSGELWTFLVSHNILNLML